MRSWVEDETVKLYSVNRLTIVIDLVFSRPGQSQGPGAALQTVLPF